MGIGEDDGLAVRTSAREERAFTESDVHFLNELFHRWYRGRLLTIAKFVTQCQLQGFRISRDQYGKYVNIGPGNDASIDEAYKEAEALGLRPGWIYEEAFTLNIVDEPR